MTILANTMTILANTDDDTSEHDDDTSEHDDDTSEHDDDTSEHDDDTSEHDDDTSEHDDDTSERKQYSVLAEVWSVGITLVHLGAGRYPYPTATYEDATTMSKKTQLLQDNDYEQLWQIAKEYCCPQLTLNQLADYIVNEPPPSLAEHIFGDDVRDFVAQCLRKEASERASIDALLQHSFLSAAVSAPDESRRLFASFITRVLEMRNRIKKEMSEPECPT